MPPIRRAAFLVAAALLVPAGIPPVRAIEGEPDPSGLYHLELPVAPVLPLGTFPVVVGAGEDAWTGEATLTTDAAGKVTGELTLEGEDLALTGSFKAKGALVSLSLKGTGPSGTLKLAGKYARGSFEGTAKGTGDWAGAPRTFVVDAASAPPLRLRAELDLAAEGAGFEGAAEGDVAGQSVALAMSAKLKGGLLLKGSGGGLAISAKGIPAAVGGYRLAWSAKGFGAKGSGTNAILARKLESTAGAVAAVSGGTLTLDGGSAIEFPAGFLGSDTQVTLNRTSGLPLRTPSGVVEGVGPALIVRFSAVPAPVAGVIAPLEEDGEPATVTLFAPEEGWTGFDGSMGTAEVVDLSGGSTFVGIPATWDPVQKKATITVPSPLVTDAREVRISLVNVVQTLAPPAGPRWFDGSKWNDGYPIQFDCSKKTAVLVHGINSNVQDAFDAKLMMKEEGYEQVVGFDYNWAQNISDSGDQLQDFLDDIAFQCEGKGTPKLDIHAHSLGTTVTIRAACNTNLNVRNFFLYGGPLTGTPAASTALGLVNGLQTLLMMTGNGAGALSPELNTLAALLDAPFAEDVQPGSDVLAMNNECLRDRLNDGVSPISGACLTVIAGRGAGSGLTYGVGKLLNALGTFGGEQNDGIIPVAAALGEGTGFDSGGGCFRRLPVLDLGHTELTRDLDVVRDVAVLTGKTTIGKFGYAKLAVTKAGSGSGEVLVDPNRSLFLKGEVVTLTAIPASGSIFARWEGDGTGAGQVRTVTMDGGRTVTAVFEPVPPTYSGDFSTSMGSHTTFAGCTFGLDLNGTLSLRPREGTGGAVLGDGDTDANLGVFVTYTPPYTSCSAYPFSQSGPGDITGTKANLQFQATNGSGAFTLDFTGVWSGNTISGSATWNQRYTADGDFVYKTGTIPNLVLTKEE